MTDQKLSSHFLQHHPRDAARVLEQFAAEQLASYISELPASISANLFRHMAPSKAASCFDTIEVNISAKILEQFSMERSSALLRRLKLSRRIEIIKAMSTVYANMVKLVIRFPEDTVGRYISPNVFTVLSHISVREALSTVKETSDQVRSDIFVVNEKQRLQGMVFIRELLFAEPDTVIAKLMSAAPDALSAKSRLALVQNNSAWKYNEMLPVVDSNGMFIGVLKRGVMLDVIARNFDFAEHDDLSNTAISIAELFWNTCADFLLPESQNNQPESQDGTGN